MKIVTPRNHDPHDLNHHSLSRRQRITEKISLNLFRHQKSMLFNILHSVSPSETVLQAKIKVCIFCSPSKNKFLRSNQN